MKDIRGPAGKSQAQAWKYLKSSRHRTGSASPSWLTRLVYLSLSELELDGINSPFGRRKGCHRAKACDDRDEGSFQLVNAPP